MILTFLTIAKTFLSGKLLWTKFAFHLVDNFQLKGICSFMNVLLSSASTAEVNGVNIRQTKTSGE